MSDLDIMLRVLIFLLTGSVLVINVLILKIRGLETDMEWLEFQTKCNQVTIPRRHLTLVGGTDV